MPSTLIRSKNHILHWITLILYSGAFTSGFPLIVVTSSRFLRRNTVFVDWSSVQHAVSESRETDPECSIAQESSRKTTIATRRQALNHAWMGAGSWLLLATTPSTSHARNLPLTTGTDATNTGTVATLIPIVRMRQSLGILQQQLRNSNNKDASTSSLALPSTSIVPREETTFKQLLDAYSDPVSYKQKFVDQNAFLVYYTKGFDGPGRPQIEDDLPVKQTLQYGARNDAWVAWDDFLVEWEFAGKTAKKEGSALRTVVADDSWEDLLPPLKRLLQALDAYLSLAPAEDLQQAQREVQ